MFTVESLPEIVEQLEASSSEAQVAYAELVALLELSPQDGEPYDSRNADGKMRTQAFGDGRGLAIYLVLDDERRVVVLSLAWLG